MNALHKLTLALPAATCLVFGVPALAATTGSAQTGDIGFLQLGDIEGESTDGNHPNWIEVTNWSWQLDYQPKAALASAGRAASGESRLSITVTKPVDKSTPSLFKACASGKHFDKATLAVRKAGGEQTDYLTIALDNAVITGDTVTPDSTGASPVPVESLSLNFAKFTTEYLLQNDDGSGAVPQEYEWKAAPAT